MVQLDSKYYVNFKLRGIPEQTSVPRPVRKYLLTSQALDWNFLDFTCTV